MGNATGVSSTVVIMAFLVFFAETWYDPVPVPDRVQNILPFVGIVIQGAITFISQRLIRNRAGEI
jgi:hypothetical protein